MSSDRTDHGDLSARRVEAPLVVRGASEVEWDQSADIVIVGFGGAGAAAAIRAQQHGASVIAVDRFAGGGATAFSGGVVYAGATRYQREAGYNETPQDMFQYLSLEDTPVRRETLQRFCEQSSTQLDWAAEQGASFSGVLFPGKTTYPPEGKFLYYSGNEKAPAYAKRAKPAPRGHRTVGKGLTGRVYFDALKTAALRGGTQLLTHAPVRRLIVDESGAILGVEVLAIPQDQWQRHQGFFNRVDPMKPFAGTKAEAAVNECAGFEQRFTARKRIRAERAVILAAGGFVNNSAMVRQHRPSYARVLTTGNRLGSMGCDGSGIELGCSVGGQAQLMDSFSLARIVAPPAMALRGVIVNREGRRFINEDAYTCFLGQAIGEQPGGQALLILDRDGFAALIKQCLFPGKGLYIFSLPMLLNIAFGGTRRAGTLVDLARKCGLDANNLQSTVSAANAGVPSKQDPLGKAPDNIAPLLRKPFYALNMNLDNKFAMTMLFSLGGLAVSEDSGAVLRSDGTEIKGLYAIGRNAVGLCSKSYLSGLAIADTLFSALRAADHATRPLASKITTSERFAAMQASSLDINS